MMRCLVATLALVSALVIPTAALAHRRHRHHHPHPCVCVVDSQHPRCVVHCTFPWNRSLPLG